MSAQGGKSNRGRTGGGAIDRNCCAPDETRGFTDYLCFICRHLWQIKRKPCPPIPFVFTVCCARRQKRSIARFSNPTPCQMASAVWIHLQSLSPGRQSRRQFQNVVHELRQWQRPFFRRNLSSSSCRTERLVYTDKFDDPNLPGQLQATITLKKVSCGTELNIVQEDMPDVHSRRDVLSRLAGVACSTGETG